MPGANWIDGKCYHRQVNNVMCWVVRSLGLILVLIISYNCSHTVYIERSFMQLPTTTVSKDNKTSPN